MNDTTPTYTQKQEVLDPLDRLNARIRAILDTTGRKSTVSGTAVYEGCESVACAVHVLTEPSIDTATSAMLCDTNVPKRQHSSSIMSIHCYVCHIPNKIVSASVSFGTQRP